MAVSDKAALYMIKGAISDLPKEDQEKVHAITAQLKELVESNAGHGMMAYALYGATMAAEAD